MKDIERRKELLENGTYKNYLKKRKNYVYNGVVFVDDFGNLDYSLFDIPINDLIICERIRKCCKEQREKVESHLMYLFNKTKYDLYFITFTFSDDSLNRTTDDTRRQNIRRLLTRSEDYILNIDYGTKTNREHYHSIVALKNGTYETREENGHIKLSFLDTYKLGTYDVEPIRKGGNDVKRLSRYISKLTLHSIKVKQKYISVKKGSDYQEWKKLNVKYINAYRNNLDRLKRMYEDELLANEL